MTCPTRRLSPIQSSAASDGIRLGDFWKGAYKPYDILREAASALGVVLALTIVLTILFSSPDDAPSTIRTWSSGDQVDFVTTAVSELGGSSALAGYGPPYNHNGNGQNIWFIHLQEWLGVSYPVDTTNGLEGIKEKLPVGRLGRPEEIARAVHFLVAHKSSYITGQTLSVSCGMDM